MAISIPRFKQVPISILRLSITTNQIVYDSLDQKTTASRPSRIGTDGNSITRIDPLTGAVGPSVYVGSEPNKLALSDDGHSLYISLDGANAIRRYDTSTQTPGLQFSSGHRTYSIANNAPVGVSDMAVAPGNPDLLAITTFYPDRNVVAFNNGVELPQRATPGADFLTFTDSASTIFGSGAYQTGLTKYSVTGSGVTDVTGNPSSFYTYKLKYQNGLLFDSFGHIINASTRALVGTCVPKVSQSNSVDTYPFVPDTATGRVFYAVNENAPDVTIKAFDINTFVQIGSLTIPNVGFNSPRASLYQIRY